MISIIFQILQWAIEIYSGAIFVWVLMSWLPGAYQSGLGKLLTKICLPFMSWFKFIPPIFGLDFSPVIALFVLQLCSNGLNYLQLLILGSIFNG